MEEAAVPVLYLDLDGTVREGKDDPLGRFVNGPDDVRVFPQAVHLMQRWKETGGRIVAISNQGGIALGIVTMRQVMDAMVETQRQCLGLFDKIMLCPHFPTAGNAEMARCWCRKPAIGMIVEAAIDLGREHDERYPPHLALFVGDRPEDQLCAAAANIDFMWASIWRGGAPNVTRVSEV